MLGDSSIMKRILLEMARVIILNRFLLPQLSCIRSSSDMYRC
ncbi:MAG: hypothetical protein OJF50_004572 [Nitrospira sp.]|nr:hypothetical protein [Nitrospira sp.]